MKKSSLLNCAGRRILALALTAALGFSLAACGSDGGADNKEQVKEWVYVPEFQTIEDENASYYDMQFSDDKLYYVSRDYDEENERWFESLSYYSLADKKLESIPIAWPEDEDDGEGWRNTSRFVVAEDGSLYLVVYIYGGEDKGSKQCLGKFDPQGNWLFTKELSKPGQGSEEMSYIQNMTLDSQGRIYVSGNSSEILLFDGEGNYVGVISLGSGDIWLDQMLQGEDGKVFVIYSSYDGSGSNTILAELDFEGKKIGKSYEGFPNSARSIMPGTDGKFLINDSTKVYEYDPETKEKTELFDWLDSDINGNYVETFGLMEDGRVLAVIRDWEIGTNEVALLTKTQASEVPQKENITIATISGGYQLRSLAVQFNKSNNQYHVSVKEYVDRDNWTENSYSDAITNLNNDITSSNSPDLIDLSGLNVSQLAAKGVFEDLNGYLEKSSALSRSDFMENILAAYTYNDKLVSVPLSFSVQTLIGHKSKLGDRDGWTLDEMIEYADANPQADLFDRVSKGEILRYLMMMNADEFIDWSEGECNFDTDTFKNLLQFVNRYPDEIDWNEDTPVTPIRVQNGEVLLYSEGIYDFKTIQEALDVFKGDAVCIGFPTVDGSSGHALTGRNAYAIASKSDSKDGAWAFIESILTKEEDDRFRSGFPTVLSKLNAMAEDAVKIEYVLDENGEPYLDENGEPIIQNAGGGIGWGDWFYEYHVPTQEEVDIVMEVMKKAKPMAYSDDDEIMSIVLEEAQPFFKGQKTVDEVTGIIQNRVNIYINENR